MELVEGETLAQVLARGPLALDETLNIGQQIADALEAAHDAAWCTAISSPPTSSSRRPACQVLDFGLARGVRPLRASRSPRFADDDESRDDRAGVILGTADT